MFVVFLLRPKRALYNLDKRVPPSLKSLWQHNIKFYISNMEQCAPSESGIDSSIHNHRKSDNSFYFFDQYLLHALNHNTKMA